MFVMQNFSHYSSIVNDRGTGMIAVKVENGLTFLIEVYNASPVGMFISRFDIEFITGSIVSLPLLHLLPYHVCTSINYAQCRTRGSLSLPYLYRQGINEGGNGWLLFLCFFRKRYSSGGSIYVQNESWMFSLLCYYCQSYAR